ncbi:MAG: 1-acyl-sn-glycerol-3-phosphate acyltransferase [Rikenellaceae bacterium]|nr:1-acyl-sn-glycerol-3-phosphate acyltransferase [Rikenellaceae bacterium]
METIDIGRLLRNKNPRLAKWIPRFVVRWVERLVRLGKINYVLANFGDQPPMKFIRSTLDYIGVTYTVHGTENIPQGRRVIFASNHPLGGLDGLMLAEAVNPHVPSVKLIVNDLLMNLEPLAPIFVPVNKYGSQSVDYARRLVEMYESDTAVITFPAGLCSRLIHGQITDPPWRRNFVQKAWESGRLVVPVYIEGRNSMFFYRFERLRKALGIKLNLGTVLLPKEMFEQKGKHLDIYIGEPVELTQEHTIREWVDIIRRKTYALKP